MTDEQVLKAVRMGDTIRYIDGEGQLKSGECIGWSREPPRWRNHVMCILTSSGHEKRIPLSNVFVKRFFS